jgi:hypothetical protein
MGKRFVDTEIWEKEWFMNLETQEKLAMFWILTKCDNVGVLNHNKALADILIGKKIDWDGIQKKCSKNIEILENGKWWVKDFVDFHWGELKETSAPYRSYIKLLKKHNLYQRVTKGYAKAIDTLAVDYTSTSHSPPIALNKRTNKSKDINKDISKDIITLYICYYSKDELNGKVPTLNERKYLQDALEYQSFEEWKPYCDEMNKQVREGMIQNRIPMKFFFGDRFHQFEPKEDVFSRSARKAEERKKK